MRASGARVRLAFRGRMSEIVLVAVGVSPALLRQDLNVVEENFISFELWFSLFAVECTGFPGYGFGRD